MFAVSFPGLGIVDLELNRVAFSVFGLDVYWYGLVIGTGLMLAILFALAKGPAYGLDPDKMIDVILITTVCAVICARFYYVIFELDQYDTFFEMINIRDGGMGIYGGVIGAFLFGGIFCKLRGVKMLPMMDLTAMGFLLGQGMGRWGNFFNQEAFGTNTDVPWGMISNGTISYLTAVQEKLALQGIIVDPNMPIHPTFLYESLWCLAGFFLLWAYSKHRKFDGEILLLYGAWYGAERAVVEGLRTDSLMWGPFRVSQVLAAVLVVVCSVALFYGYKRTKKLNAMGIATITPPFIPANKEVEVELYALEDEEVIEIEPAEKTQQEIDTDNI